MERIDEQRALLVPLYSGFDEERFHHLTAVLHQAGHLEARNGWTYWVLHMLDKNDPNTYTLPASDLK